MSKFAPVLVKGRSVMVRAVRHFARGWSYAAAEALGRDLRKAITDGPGALDREGVVKRHFCRAMLGNRVPHTSVLRVGPVTAGGWPNPCLQEGFQGALFLAAGEGMIFRSFERIVRLHPLLSYS